MAAKIPAHTSQNTSKNDTCQEQLPARALVGLRLFNEGNYFEAHEALEDAWRAEKGPIRDLYRAILQVGLGYHQILRRNYKGAIKMFRRCKPWLEPFPDQCRGIDLADLRQCFTLVETTLLQLGPDQIDEFPVSLIKPVIFSVGGSNDG